jgi:hypothetical protein
VQVDYAEGDPDLYVLPLTAAFGADAARMREGFPHPLLANLQVRGRSGHPPEVGILYDALYEKASVRCYWTLSYGTAACVASTVISSPPQPRLASLTL